MPAAFSDQRIGGAAVFGEIFPSASSSTGCGGWDCILSNGLTAGQTMVEIHAMLSSLTQASIADAVWSKVLP